MKSLLLSLLKLLIACFACFPASAQVFRYFSDRDGAPVAVVFSIAQDREGYMWFGTTVGLYRYDSRTFKHYKYEPGKAGSLPSDIVRSVFCDSEGALWIGTDAGLSLYNSHRDSFTNFSYDPKDSISPGGEKVYKIIEDSQKRIWAGTADGLCLITRGADGAIAARQMLPKQISGASRAVRSLAEGKDGTLWVGTYNGLIRYENPENVRIYRRPDDPQSPRINEYLTLQVDEEGKVWLGSNHKGLAVFDPHTGLFELKEEFRTERGELPVVNEIAEEKPGVYWIATESGLARYDRVDNKLKWYYHEPEKSYSLVDDVLYSVCIDRQKSVWVGSYYTGISYFNNNSPEFTVWPSPDTGVPYTDFMNGWMGISGDGTKWCINYGKNQLVIFDGKSGEISSRKLSLNSPETYHAFYLDENKRLWCARLASLACMDLITGEFRDYPYSEAGQETIQGRGYTIVEDRQGRIWLGGIFGLMSFDKGTGKFRRLSPTGGAWSVFEDSKDNIWAVCEDNVLLLERGASEFVNVPLSNKMAFEGKYHACRVAEDKVGRIWIASKPGLLLFDKETGTLGSYREKSGIDLGPVFDVQVDDKGYLWLNGYHKLIRHHPDKEGVQTFGYLDGLPANSILLFAGSAKDANGVLYFITNKALFSFDPGKMTDDVTPSSIVPTSVRLFGDEVYTADETTIVRQVSGAIKELAFRHDQNVFTLEFALLSFIRSERNQYAYKLEGFEKEWNYVRVPSATYTNLPAGSYTFLARAANGDGYWMEDPLEIRITVFPPWWKTWYAYSVYLFLFVGLVYGVTRFFWLRSAFRKENELYQAKLDFFTNISHEIRTHLSLISSPIEKVFQSSSVGEDARNVLKYAKNNSDRLMLLVNELLDFRKLQNGGIRLRVSEQDLVKALANALAAFEHQAKEKSITTVLNTPGTPVMLWFDLVQMQKVFYNLLSNAYKFTTVGGQVTIDIAPGEEEVLIKISDNGVGIAPEHLRHLFTNFFQVYENNSSNTGYGIGLALSKSIVELHKGRLSVSSRRRTESEQGGTCFTISMRPGIAHLDNPDIVQNTGALAVIGKEEPALLSGMPAIAGQEKTHSLLIIDDNDELRAFAVEMFRNVYTVWEADNGKAGLTLAREHIPDLVISDVMMPEMNGLEVCGALKADFNTRHIPVILVSARSTTSQMMEGLNAGADDYLVKPFDFGVLSLKVANLIAVREALARQYRSSVSLDPGELVVDNPDTAFINQLKEIVLANISDSKFGVNEIALHTGLSVSVLYRKLRALTGMTVNDFVKTLRLKRAGQLLEAGQYNVNEVATEVGFEDSRYFSREFRKVYGKTPTEVRRLGREDSKDNGKPL